LKKKHTKKLKNKRQEIAQFKTESEKQSERIKFLTQQNNNLEKEKQIIEKNFIELETIAKNYYQSSQQELKQTKSTNIL
jgi:hypothetical protein